MAEKKSLVEEALIQMKSLENVVAENAKGILASTMKEEIGELVKESLKGTESDSDVDMDGEDMKFSFDEQEEEDMDTEIDIDDTDDNEDVEGMDDMEDDEEFDFSGMDDEDFGDEPIDLTNASDEEILKVFKAMGDEDGIIVKKDGDTIDLEDSNADVEYKISLGEQEEDEVETMEMEEDFDFSFNDDEDDDFEEIDLSDMGEDDEEEEVDFDFNSLMGDESEDDEEEEIMFEIEFGDEEGEEDEISMDEWNESEDIEKMETKESFKAKGVGMGKAKFSYNKTQGGFKEDMKHGNPTKGTGKPKFEFKEGDDMGKKPMMKKPMMKKEGETTEASRTLGNGKRWGRNGLDKPKAAPQHLKVESTNNQINLLREKNEEYRKALNVFRDKLNEVAVFNSNLAYATRLFTEHSTTKQEKINILRRFDSVETLKESKTLYKTIKDELSSQGTATVVKESIQEKMERTPASGSAVNLIESKTYENPQFMRMKDLMTKMNVVK